MQCSRWFWVLPRILKAPCPAGSHPEKKVFFPLENRCISTNTWSWDLIFWHELGLILKRPKMGSICWNLDFGGGISSRSWPPQIPTLKFNGIPLKIQWKHHKIPLWTVDFTFDFACLVAFNLQESFSSIYDTFPLGFWGKNSTIWQKMIQLKVGGDRWARSL